MLRKTEPAARGIIILLPVLLLAGCPRQHTQMRAPLAFTPMSERLPRVAYCNDHTGHVAGSKPFVLGGKCCCTPTQKLIDAYHRDGLLLDYDLGRLKELYSGLDIKTAHDHRDCNNRCAWGPHILQGGSCMVPPTPGTQHFEEIITGRFHLPEETAEPQ